MSLAGQQKIAVLMGGSSEEREVSLASGKAVLDALLSENVNAEAFDPATSKLIDLPARGYAAVWNVLHGTGGEDGVVQGFFESVGIPYTGSGVLASALTMNKAHSKRVLQAAGLPTPDWRYLTPADDAEKALKELGLPVVIKPVSQGSSVGMSLVREASELAAAIELAFSVEPQLLMEVLIEGPEHTVSVLGDQPLPSIRIETPRTFYDYQAKYEVDSTRYICPGLDEVDERRYQAMALAAFRLFCCRGWGRVDFISDAKCLQPYILELNTVPGMTSHSLVPMAAKAMGMSFGEFCVAVLDQALACASDQNEKGSGYGT